MLQTVVYNNKRPGFDQTMRGLYALKVAKSNREITNDTWENTIQPGMHIEQWMIVPDTTSEARFCPFPGCSGTLPSDGDVDPKWCVMSSGSPPWPFTSFLLADDCGDDLVLSANAPAAEHKNTETLSRLRKSVMLL